MCEVIIDSLGIRIIIRLSKMYIGIENGEGRGTVPVVGEEWRLWKGEGSHRGNTDCAHECDHIPPQSK